MNLTGRVPRTEAAVLVRDAMTQHVISVSMDVSLGEVRHIFEAASFHHLIVTDAHKVVGVLSDRDLLKHISPFIGKMAERTQDLAVLKRRVHQVMTRNLCTASPDTPLADAGRIMLNRKISCLPVVDDDDHLEGIITIRDLARVALDILGDEALNNAA